jgi:hypothetical protein
VKARLLRLLQRARLLRPAYRAYEWLRSRGRRGGDAERGQQRPEGAGYSARSRTGGERAEHNHNGKEGRDEREAVLVEDQLDRVPDRGQLDE